jgi:hypothetical protein
MARIPGKLTTIPLAQKQRLAFRDWARYTHEDLLKGLIKHKIHSTGQLKASVKYRLTGERGGKMSAEFTYLMYGTFVDMGVGFGRVARDQRNPRYWYNSAMRRNHIRLGVIMQRMNYGGFPRLFETLPKIVGK